MGRRSDLKNELNPICERLVEIIASSEYRGIRFADIVVFAGKSGISRSTVARYIKTMVKKGIIKKEGGGYRLAMEAIQWKHTQRSLFSVLAMHIFDDVLEKASSKDLTDEEFTKKFTSKVGALAMYTILVGLSKAQSSPDEAGKWIEEAFGTLIQKNGWRICLNRQIFGGPISLKTPINLKQPVAPEIKIEDGVIYIKLPASIEPGLTSKVLKELPIIPKNRLESLKATLKKLYPNEIELLDNILNQIREASRLSRIEVEQ